MTTPAVFWPALLGAAFLVAGLITYHRDASRLLAPGPVFVAASLAAFAGEHFTAAASIAAIVPPWLPGRLFIAYFVGAAHLAAALSFVTRRYVRWSALCLAIMFGLFVLLMDLPGALTRPSVRLGWFLAARETTFAIGGLSLFATAIRDLRPRLATAIATVARFWTAIVLIVYGTQNVLQPQFTPGVPDATPTAAWVPFPVAIACATGLLLIACGIAMLFANRAAGGAAFGGLLMLVLTLVLYVPQFFLVSTAPERVVAINFIFDTMLFGGTMLVIGNAISITRSELGRARSASFLLRFE